MLYEVRRYEINFVISHEIYFFVRRRIKSKVFIYLVMENGIYFGMN